jgi:DNA-binding winged helix-turn-helix (wHTH) protein/Tol biopolymer transport system component
MGAPTNTAGTWRFGAFEFDAQSTELRRSGVLIKLREQSSRVLLYLLEHAGQVVTREELRQCLWPSDTFVDFDHSLNAAVMKLRDALGDSADKPLYIATIPKRGYRFVAPVSFVQTTIFPARVSLNGSVKKQQCPPTVEINIPSNSKEEQPTDRHWAPAPFLLVGLCALVTGILTAIFLSIRAVTRHESPAYGVTEQRVTSNPPEAPVESGVVSPDGKYLAYSDPTGLYLRVIASGETRRWDVPKDFIARPSSWFPDGTHLLAMRLEGTPPKPSLWKLSLLGGNPRKLIDNVGSGSVSPDGTRIAFVAFLPSWGRELWVMDADGSNPRKIAESGSPESSIYPPAWSPDGRRIAYIERHEFVPPNPTLKLSSVWTRDADGGDLQPIVKNSGLGTGIAWTPDGRILFASRTNPAGERDHEGVRFIRVDERTGKATGTPQLVTDGEGSIGKISITSDGKRLVLCRTSTQLQAFIAGFDARTRKWEKPQRLTLDANNNLAFAWLADGRTVLFASNRNGKWALFKQAIDETTAELLVEGRTGPPRLSADGAHVLYPTRADPANSSIPVSLMRLPVAGGSPQLVLKDLNITNFQCARLPSTLCLFSKAQGGHAVYVSFDPEGGVGRELLRSGGNFDNWTLSPDGETLAVFPGDHRIQFFSLENEVFHESNTITLNDWWVPNGDWSADGKGVLIPSLTPAGIPVILEVNRAGKASVVLDGVAHTGFWAMVPAPDGHHGILDAEVPGDNNAWMINNF